MTRIFGGGIIIIIIIIILAIGAIIMGAREDKNN